MRYLSVCSGMEAASVAWHPLGWTPVGFSEIEPFPCAILKHRFPNTPNYGSLTEYQSWPLEPGAIDLLVGGCPCQSFSVAGLRRGMQDPRGNLTLTYLGLADKLKPKWIVYENVPGLLSSNGGKDFGSFLGALVELGYGFAYRVLDAQYVGGPRAVPQRRRRVFVVACLGDWRAAAEVLSISESLPGNIEKVRKIREQYSGKTQDGPESWEPNCTVSGTIRANPGSGWRSNGTPVEPVVFNNSCVRRLSPIETERLQGFPDNWSRISWKGKAETECPDGPRYKACGNSMAVPVMAFIGRRIAEVDATLSPNA
jgi:DNA (cytosine-5)-methyltransferase 1